MEFAAETTGLIQEAKDGSREAFAQLVRLSHTSVRTYVARYLGNDPAVDDLAQEVFLVAFRRITEYRGDAPFVAWLLGIARNQALAHLRSESRRRRREQQAFISALAEWQAQRLTEPGLAPDDHERRVEALQSCVERLPSASRQVVDLFYFESQTTESIARRIGKNSGAVRMMLLRIRRALANCVAAKLGGAED